MYNRPPPHALEEVALISDSPMHQRQWPPCPCGRAEHLASLVELRLGLSQLLCLGELGAT